MRQREDRRKVARSQNSAKQTANAGSHLHLPLHLPHLSLLHPLAVPDRSRYPGQSRGEVVLGEGGGGSVRCGGLGVGYEGGAGCYVFLDLGGTREGKTGEG